MPIIDFHAHAVPDSIHQFLPAGLRSQAKQWLRPVMSTLHRGQPYMRWLPESIRRGTDELSALLPIPGLLIEGTAQDLVDAMEEADVDQTVLIAHPPFISNEWVLKTCQSFPQLIPAVNVSREYSGEKLREYIEKGARILKIHPAADSEGVDSPRYRELLKVASEAALPVIIHTGCLHSHLYYKDPEQGHAERFAPWFAEFSKTQFILAHMNFNAPTVAMDLAEEYPNVHVDTSWQPSEVIGEAVRRIGAQRVLFGTDWPFIGSNITVGLKRIQDCVKSGLITTSDSELILGENATKLLCR
jgi:uncharacterized protein